MGVGTPRLKPLRLEGGSSPPEVLIERPGFERHGRMAHHRPGFGSYVSPIGPRGHVRDVRQSRMGAGIARTKAPQLPKWNTAELLA